MNTRNNKQMNAPERSDSKIKCLGVWHENFITVRDDSSKAFVPIGHTVFEQCVVMHFIRRVLAQAEIHHVSYVHISKS
jgi:hypothetical protein